MIYIIITQLCAINMYFALTKQILYLEILNTHVPNSEPPLQGGRVLFLLPATAAFSAETRCWGGVLAIRMLQAKLFRECACSQRRLPDS
jgi:hypothetical protein